MIPSSRKPFLLLPHAALLLFGGLWLVAQPDNATLLPVGAARIDVTPAYPIRLSGYGNRTTVSEGVEQKLWAKAIAFGRTAEDSSVLITVDNVGVPFEVTDAVYERVHAKQPLPRANFAVCATHTHNGPMLNGVLPNLFSKDFTLEEQETVDRYTAEFTEKLAQVALDALENRQPATLAWGEGRAGFAKNRRKSANGDGPVDHALPILAVRSPEGRLRAVLANYACHCTTLGGDFNRCGGDWAGYAQESMEEAFPDSIALVSIGCGADANPHPRTGLEFAQTHGREIATEVQRLLATSLHAVKALPSGAASDFPLPFEPLPTRGEWEERASAEGITGYHARKNLARLDRGETLSGALPYRVQSWTFGDDLAMLFLAGEVVVDYATKLKGDCRSLWINAYANDVKAYIPSTRILDEGGYEAGGALPYYDQPARLGPDTETLILNEVAKLVPAAFRAEKTSTGKMEGVAPPTTPQESLGKISGRPGFTVQLAASEPQIVDPVAIDFGADGRLWVVEMHDYPSGLGEEGLPGGRVKFLQDLDGDGFYETATLFLDGLPYPTGMMPWGDGVLICSAPDILYAVDTDGDGRADQVETWFTGFAKDNFQARVNGLTYGLDGWIYGANGLLGGVIQGAPGTPPVDIRGRDFRFHPVTRVLEPVSGLTQQGRVRDDFGNWFGSDNGTFAWHYPLAERYLARNPHVAPPQLRVSVAKSPGVFPTSRTLERFNNPDHTNRATGTCGGDVYRDVLLGEEVYGDFFVNETVHNLATRLKLEPAGATFTGPRVPGEENSEFFASSDNWSRPVQVRTGPDGALWVVDMYRYVIEHPKWIPAEHLAKLDVRAGDDKGRLYRVLPEGVEPRPIRDLTRLSPIELADAFDTPNGPVRDLIQARLVQLGAKDTAPRLADLAANSDWPATRAQALATLAALESLTPEHLAAALTDPHPGVRRVALVLGEPFYQNHPALTAGGTALTDDADAAVRYQLALSLGEAQSPSITAALSQLAGKDMGDSWMRAAILSSSVDCADEVLAAVLSSPVAAPGRTELARGLIVTAASTGDDATLDRLTALLADGISESASAEAWRFAAWADFLQTLERRKIQPATLLARAAQGEASASLSRLWEAASTLAFDAAQPVALRQSTLALCALRDDLSATELAQLAAMFENPAEETLRPAALAALRRQPAEGLTAVLLQDWSLRSPTARAAFVELLLGRDDTLVPLLTALENGSVSGAEIPVPQRERFLAHADDGIKTRADKVFAAFQPRQRTEVLDAYQGVADLTGNESKGREIFQMVCAVCHQLHGVGQSVGPDLEIFQGKGVPEFLEAILNPNGIVEPRYLNYLVELKDGRTLSGLIGNETTASLTLRQAGGLQETVARADIQEMKASPLSMMPEGLEHAIPPAVMADLIAFLKGGAPRPFGSATSESAAAARQTFGPEQANGLALILEAGTLFDYASWLGKLPLAHCHQTDGTQKVVWRTAPAPAAVEAGQMYEFRFPGGLGHLSQPEGSFALYVNDRRVLDFGVALDKHEWASSDGTVVLSYEPKEVGGQDSNGIFTLGVRGSRLTAGQPLTLQVVGSPTQSRRWFGAYAFSAGQMRLKEEVGKPTR